MPLATNTWSTWQRRNVSCQASGEPKLPANIRLERVQQSSGSFQMSRHALIFIVLIAFFTSVGFARQVGTDGPYKVLKTARVGGEGGTDYIFADSVGRRLYITRGATQAQPATE